MRREDRGEGRIVGGLNSLETTATEKIGRENLTLLEACESGLLKIFDLMAQLRSAPKLLWPIFTPIKEFYGTNTHAHINTFKTPNKQYFGFAIYFKTKKYKLPHFGK